MSTAIEAYSGNEWDDLTDQERAAVAKFYKPIGLDPRSAWTDRQAAHKWEWRRNFSDGPPVDTHAEDESRIVAASDPETAAAFDNLPEPEGSPPAFGANVIPLDPDTYAAAGDGHRLTDVGNAARLVDLAGGRIRFVHSWGRWIVFRQGRWQLDPDGALVAEEAKAVARHLLRLMARGRGRERDELYAAARKAESAAGVRSMVTLARGVDGVLVDYRDLDADPYKLNVSNGTVDLRTGQLRDHDPDDLITKMAPVPFDPEAVAPLWKACLDRWQPDAEVREYLQREMGAGATGDATETLSINLGAGGNGKTKFFGSIMEVLGDYATVPHKSLLVATRHEQHATVVASLFRARLAVASETDALARLEESTVKNLTGGDKLSARRMREDEWTFSPSHTLCMFSNFRPEIRGTDDGIWRRVRLVPWTVTIPAEERDEHLDRKLRDEAPGILRWLVEGAGRYIEKGLTPPESIRAASNAYREESDTVGKFFGAVGLVFQRGADIPTSDLREAHDDWSVDAGIRSADRHWAQVTKALRDGGATPAKRKGGARVWENVALENTAAIQ